MLELGVAAAVLAADAGVVRVHEHVGADLQLVVDAARRLEREGAGAGAADDLAGELLVGERRERLVDRVDRVGDRLGALLIGRQMLGAAVIGLQPAEFEVGRVGNPPRERRRVAAGRDPAALHADFELDQGAEFDAGLLGDARRGVDLLGRVETQRDLRLAREPGEAAQLALAHHLVAHQDVGDAAAHQRLGLAHFLHALADRAGRDLPPRDRRAFVGFGMRAHAHARGARDAGHLGDVAVEGVEVDHQRRRLDIGDGGTNRGGRQVHGFAWRSELKREHDVFRKPVPTFRHHALAYAEAALHVHGSASRLLN